MSERHACRLMGLGRTTHRYRARKAERDSELRARLKKLAAKRMRFGYRRLTAMLVREGMPTNHKRVYRLYREEGWAMRIRQRRRIRWRGAVTSPAATRPNERWSMDFVSDCVATGRVIRMLTIVDGCTRECPAIEVDTSLGGLRTSTGDRVINVSPRSSSNASTPPFSQHSSGTSVRALFSRQVVDVIRFETKSRSQAN